MAEGKYLGKAEGTFETKGACGKEGIDTPRGIVGDVFEGEDDGEKGILKGSGARRDGKGVGKGLGRDVGRNVCTYVGRDDGRDVGRNIGIDECIAVGNNVGGSVISLPVRQL